MIVLALLAAGFFYPDIGATPLGRAGTGSAGAGDLAAMAMNPAGLASLLLPAGPVEPVQAASVTRRASVTRGGLWLIAAL